MDNLHHQLAEALRGMNVELSEGSPEKSTDRPHIARAKQALAAYDSAKSKEQAHG